jgi:hypothetical protein
MLPAAKSSPAEIVAGLIDLRARFHGWLHQDEFGPSRGEQTAALKAHINSVRQLCQLLAMGSLGDRTRLDAALRNNNDGFSAAIAVLDEAVARLQSALQIEGAPAPDIYWISRLMGCGEKLLMQIEALDDTTDGQIALIAICRKFELSQPIAAKEVGLVEVERWLNGYWDVLLETLHTLSDRRGAQERVSLKLLVEELCNLYERETEQLVTAHAIKEDVYTSHVETPAGRFVTAAVEAMLPDQSWFDRHIQFADAVCADTLLLDEQGNHRRVARARQILAIMRNFVSRRRSRGLPTI